MAPRMMLQLMQMMLAFVHAVFANKSVLAMENLALRQQLAVYKRKQPRPRLTDLDRAFWTVLKDQFAAWADALVIVKPETVVRWQRKRFRDFWRRKSKPGRPAIDRQHIEFIKRISGDHPLGSELHNSLRSLDSYFRVAGRQKRTCADLGPWRWCGQGRKGTRFDTRWSEILASGKALRAALNRPDELLPKRACLRYHGPS